MPTPTIAPNANAVVPLTGTNAPTGGTTAQVWKAGVPIASPIAQYPSIDDAPVGGSDWYTIGALVSVDGAPGILLHVSSAAANGNDYELRLANGGTPRSGPFNVNVGNPPAKPDPPTIKAGGVLVEGVPRIQVRVNEA